MEPSLLQRCQQRLESGVKAFDLNLDSSQIQQLLGYLQLLHKWNRAYNLTSVRDPFEMVERHLLDSLSIACYVESNRIIDVGTGPGLPGIPLAICYPQKTFMLLDSNGKRTRFLHQVKLELKLTNVDIHQGRVETHQPDHGYDEVISRAFASVTDMLNWTAEVCADGGRFLAMKGQLSEDEIANLPNGFKLQQVHRLAVPGSDAERHLVILVKSADQKGDRTCG